MQHSDFPNLHPTTDVEKTIEEYGSEIRGNDGVGVFAKSQGYYVEHFTNTPQGNVMLQCKIGPYRFRNVAEVVESMYRKRWDPVMNEHFPLAK